MSEATIKRSTIAPLVLAAAIGGAAISGATIVALDAKAPVPLQTMCFVFQPPQPDGGTPVLLIAEKQRKDGQPPQPQLSVMTQQGEALNTSAKALAPEVMKLWSKAGVPK